MESFYRDMAETSVDGLWVIGLDGRTRYANPAMASMFGLPREEFAELTVYDTLDEAGRVQFEAHLEDVRAGRANPEPVDVYFVRHDGTGMWTLVSEQILREDDEIVGVLHRLSVNEERRRRMDELAENRRQLAEAHDIARLGSFYVDAEAETITCSSVALCEVFGLQPGDPLPTADWLARVHEDDRGHLEGQLAAVLTDGGDFDVVVRVAGPDGWIWTRGRGIERRDEHGTVVGIAGTQQDVTAHKQTEQALERHIARNALVQAVATACNDARSLHDVLAELRVFVRDRPEWATVRAFVPDRDGGDVIALVVPPEESDDGGDHAIAREALNGREVRYDSTGTVVAFPVHFAGSVHAVFTLTTAGVPEEPEQLMSTVGETATLLSRVVEREHAEQQLQAARDEAILASQAKSEFLAVMSHEIRTPLNGVIGLNDLMLKTSLERRQRQLARGIRDAGRSLLRLVNDVLDLSKIEAGHLELETVDFEVREVCDRAAELMGDAARRKGVELAVACDPEVPEVLAGDPTRLGQVLSNLVSNAVKFTETGHVLVHVGSSWIGRRVRLTIDVTDTGQGIAAEALERVFDDFSQADLSTTRVHGGTGLGLSISRHIARALDGELSVVSTLGEGSTFTFTATLEVPRGSRTCPDDDVARARLSGGRVLVVSDSSSRAAALHDQLALWRTRVDCVTDGDTAAVAVHAATAADDPYEAVVVDVPAARPHEITQTADLLALVGDEPSFLLLTQRPDAAVVWAMREPTVQVLTKPVTNASLRDALLGVDEDEEPVSATTATLVRTDRPRVLVVEDNQVNQLVATGMLESLGYEFDLAEDGIEAVELFDPERHDGVLMDVQMPRMDGYDATRAMRKRHGPGTPIIAMTAAAVDGERERCLASGMDDYLTKPVELNKLGAALVRWVPASPHGLAGSPAVPATTEPPGTPPDPAVPPGVLPAVPPAILDALDPRVPPKPRGTADGAAPDEAGEGAAHGTPAEAEDETRTVLDASRLDALLEMGPRAETYLANALANFVAQQPQLLDDIRAAIAAQDLEAVEQAAHKLAGSALNLGLTEVGVAARAVELRDEAGCPAEAYTPLVAALEAASRARPARAGGLPRVPRGPPQPRTRFGGAGGARTRDPRIMSPLL